MPDQPSSDDDLLTSAEVADLLRVDARTVNRWARTLRIRSLTLPGGQRRYRRGDIREQMGALSFLASKRPGGQQ